MCKAGFSTNCNQVESHWQNTVHVLRSTPAAPETSGMATFSADRDLLKTSAESSGRLQSCSKSPSFLQLSGAEICLRRSIARKKRLSSSTAFTSTALHQLLLPRLAETIAVLALAVIVKATAKDGWRLGSVAVRLRTRCAVSRRDGAESPDQGCEACVNRCVEAATRQAARKLT